MQNDTAKTYFDKLYLGSTDPFRNWSDHYEVDKREMVLQMLSKPSYRRIFEPGCGNGGLSRDLAPRGESLLSCDWSKDALVSAQFHCAGLGNIEFQEMDFPNQLPEPDQREFDLVVVSELLYYYSPETLELFFESVPKILKKGGEILLVHWRGLSNDYPSGGDAVHAAFHKRPEFEIFQTFENPKFLISSGFLK